MQASPFLLIPFGDRHIEQDHKPLSDGHRKTLMTRAGDRCSIQRMKHIEQELPNPPWQKIFADHYCEISLTRGLINALGLEGHPLFEEYLATTIPRDLKENEHKQIRDALNIYVV